MSIDAVLSMLILLLVSLMWVLKPQWIIKILRFSSTPKSESKLMNNVIRIVGGIGLIFTIFSIIYTLFFAK